MITRILEALFTWISGVISAIGYPGVALLMAIESCCIPLPSEMIMPFAGWLVATGRSPEDGLVEAIELPSKRFALGVLWHPEEDEASGVIGALVEAAASAARAVALPQAPG